MGDPRYCPHCGMPDCPEADQFDGSGTTNQKVDSDGSGGGDDA